MKDELSVNVELASPADFLPLPAGWRERSLFIERAGRLTFRHFDLYSQARWQSWSGATNVADVEAMLGRRLVERNRLWAFFDEIAPGLYRFPAIDPSDFARSIEEVVGGRA